MYQCRYKINKFLIFFKCILVIFFIAFILALILVSSNRESDLNIKISMYIHNQSLLIICLFTSEHTHQALSCAFVTKIKM